MSSEKIYTEPPQQFFFDTYAFFEILRGNKNYQKYKKSGIITTKLNIFELYVGLTREYNKEIADKVLNEYYQYVIEFDKETIKKSSLLKMSLNKRDISMTDCIGYILAQELDIKFLTGDKEFEHFPNVEFVK